MTRAPGSSRPNGAAPRPAHISAHTPSPQAAPRRRRLSPRNIAENLATFLIAAGFLMLVQPFSLALYGWSFAVALTGTALFVIGSKFPD